jgi:hypothetical protein
VNLDRLPTLSCRHRVAFFKSMIFLNEPRAS